LQLFQKASAFDQNIAAWNVLRVSNLVSAFGSASALSSCNKGAIYLAWGTTLRAAYPTWSSMCGASCSLTCLVDGNIATAATAWVTSPTTAAATYGNIAEWDVSAVSNMYQLFCNKPTFNGNIGAWNVASVTNMAQIFQGATAFNGNIGSWNVASVSNMLYMFNSATAFNADIGSWNTASVKDMQHMFHQATAFNANIGAWNTAFVTTMQEMFCKATTFNQDISKWNVAAVAVFTLGSGWGMFNSATAFNQNIASWNVLKVSTLTSAFDSASALSSCNKGAVYRLWGATLRTAYPTWSSESSACLIDDNVATAATAWVTDSTTAAATYGNIADWNMAAVSNMYRLFHSKPTFNADIGKWNVASVTLMQGMLNSAAAFNANIGSWNTASVTTMYYMFYAAAKFNQNIASWNVLRVSNFELAFDSATALSATNKRALYQAWGATLQAEYPSWTASPTARSRSRRSRPTCCTRAHALRTHR
jgi:surface protein